MEMERQIAIRRLEELAEEMYAIMDEMEGIIEEVAPEELDRVRSYWMAHIDGALLNRAGYLGGSFISLDNTIKTIGGGDF